MTSEPLLSPELWARTPPEAQADIRALEASVAALEAMVPPWREPRQQDARTSSRPPSRAPPQAVSTRPPREPTGRRPGGKPATRGRHGACCRAKRWTSWSPSHPSGAGGASRRGRARIPSRSALKCASSGGLGGSAQPVAKRRARRGPLACRPGASGRGGRRLRRCAPGPRTWRSARPSASCRSCAASRWAWARARPWSRRPCRRWPRPWRKPGPMSNSPRPRTWTRRGGAPGSSGPGCGAPARRGSPCL